MNISSCSFERKAHGQYLGTARFRCPSGADVSAAVYQCDGEIYFSDDGLDPNRQPLSVGEATHEIQNALRESLRKICPELFVAGDAL
jgi:hypothetical protein